MPTYWTDIDKRLLCLFQSDKIIQKSKIILLHASIVVVNM